ncbi:MAG: UDP-GlcNAc:undecaprenyl-phosphate GlcNAc-1-phosphate transferase [Polaribacter sp.]|jgi:UDP-GlcNAc:undecaprenyl-phosphate GlcNAc-1-phosphate transferase
MNTYVLVFMILTVVSFLYLKIATKYKIIDKPNKRSAHTKVTVLGGGILFPLAMFLFFIFNKYQYPYFFVSVVLISIISFLDDIYTLSSKIRFLFQFIAVFLVLYEVGLPFDPIYMFVIYVVTGIGIVNMFNFMDGVNGITGLYSFAVISVLYLINSKEQIVNSELLIYVFISIIVFGFYNFRRKALFFAGDIGSISMGVFILFIVLYLAHTLKSPVIILLLVVYSADAGSTILYRFFFTKESVLEPHRHHIYRRLVDLKKMSHLKVSAIYGCTQLMVNSIVYNTYNLGMQIQFVILVLLISLFVAFYIYLFKKLKEKSKLK